VLLYFDEVTSSLSRRDLRELRERRYDLILSRQYTHLLFAPELINEPWIMQEPQSWNYQRLAEACHARGIAMPRASMVTLSMPVITHFLADGRFITSMPRSVAYFCSLKVLPVDLPVRPWPINTVTLKHRTLSPIIERFIECAREVTRPMREVRSARKR